MTEAIVVLVTTPTPERAAELARALVEERLAACGNVVPGLRSIYRWEGKLEDEAEALLVLKTTQARFEALKARAPIALACGRWGGWCRWRRARRRRRAPR